MRHSKSASYSHPLFTTNEPLWSVSPRLPPTNPNPHFNRHPESKNCLPSARICRIQANSIEPRIPSHFSLFQPARNWVLSFNAPGHKSYRIRFRSAIKGFVPSYLASESFYCQDASAHTHTADRFFSTFFSNYFYIIGNENQFLPIFPLPLVSKRVIVKGALYGKLPYPLHIWSRRRNTFRHIDIHIVVGCCYGCATPVPSSEAILCTQLFAMAWRQNSSWHIHRTKAHTLEARSLPVSPSRNPPGYRWLRNGFSLLRSLTAPTTTTTTPTREGSISGMNDSGKVSICAGARFILLSPDPVEEYSCQTHSLEEIKTRWLTLLQNWSLYGAVFGI